MAIRKPSLSVAEARRLAAIRSAASEQLAGRKAPPSPTLSAGSGEQAGSVSPSLNSVTEASGGYTSGTDARSVTPDLDRKAVSLKKTNNAETSKPPVPLPPERGRPAVEADSELRPASARQRLIRSKPSSKTEASSDPAASLPPLFSASTAQEKVQIFLSAPLPALGVSPTYEMLCQQYHPKKALQMILRRALGEYEEMLESGAFQRAAVTYTSLAPEGTRFDVQTSRMMPKILVAVARAHFDPLGFESSRAFGRKLGTAALAAFFASESRR